MKGLRHIAFLHNTGDIMYSRFFVQELVFFFLLFAPALSNQLCFARNKMPPSVLEFTGIQREIEWPLLQRPVPIESETALQNLGVLIQRGEFGTPTDTRMEEIRRASEGLGMSLAQATSIRKQAMRKVRWIDSKNFFGSRTAKYFLKGLQKQVNKYETAVGDTGAIVYHHGFSSSLADSLPSTLMLDCGPLVELEGVS